MNYLESEISALYASTHELCYLGMGGRSIYSDQFTRLNHGVFSQANALYDRHDDNDKEEARLYLSLLMGYNMTLYNNDDKEKRIQHILNRCWGVLEHLPVSLLKAQLLVYCYRRVFGEELARGAQSIIDMWQDRELSEEEREVIECLKDVQGNPYPWSEMEWFRYSNLKGAYSVWSTILRSLSSIMINITDKSKCCGCNAYGDVYAHNAITFEADVEGF